MEKQQSTLRRAISGAVKPRRGGEAQKSFAAEPIRSAPHRVVDLRNRITAGNPASTAVPPGNAAPAAPKAGDANRQGSA